MPRPKIEVFALLTHDGEPIEWTNAPLPAEITPETNEQMVSWAAGVVAKHSDHPTHEWAVNLRWTTDHITREVRYGGNRRAFPLIADDEMNESDPEDQILLDASKAIDQGLTNRLAASAATT